MNAKIGKIMKEILVIFFLAAGALTILIAAIGLLKMPDVYLRMSASTIGGTFGVAFMLIGAALHFFSFSIAMQVLGVLIFLILTVPIGAQLLAKAAYIMKLPIWEKTGYDAMANQYDAETKSFKPHEPANATPSDTQPKL